MKKMILLTLAMIVFSGMAQAQYKPEKGNFTTELQFSPFNLSYNEYEDNFNSNPLSLDGLRMRYFFNEKWAIRANIKFNYMSMKQSEDIDRKGSDYWTPQYHQYGEVSSKKSVIDFRIAPGFEYHFGNMERLSIYTGAEIFFGLRNYRFNMDSDITYTAINSNNDVASTRTVFELESKSTWATYNEDYNDGIGITHRSSWIIGANLFLGMDFYVYKGLYLGAELGLGYEHYFYRKGKVDGEITITTIYNNEPLGTETEELKKETNDKSSLTAAGFGCEPKIRLGWRF